MLDTSPCFFSAKRTTASRDTFSMSRGSNSLISPEMFTEVICFILTRKDVKRETSKKESLSIILC